MDEHESDERDGDAEAAPSAEGLGVTERAGHVREAGGNFAAPAPDIESKADRLAVVAAQAAVCVACALAKTRTRVVFGEGNPEAPLMLIGEGPGQNEDSTGRPFVGRAGVLLDACLRENGISRKHIYITNVVRCRPTLVESGTVKNRPPTPEEVRACTHWLEQTIAIVQPRVILCLGAPAASFIIHKGFKMTQQRSQWFESKYARYAMAAWHPAYILRQEGEAYEAARQSLVADIGTARQKVIEAKREPKMTLF
jgi:uracil-DNA glycosylase